MKYFIFLLVLCSSILYSQNDFNPDGYIGYFSFHLTPYFNSGVIEYKTSQEQLIGTEQISSELGFNFLVKFPLSSNFTIAGFYNYEPYKGEFAGSNILSQLTKGSKNIYGVTFSLYTH